MSIPGLRLWTDGRRLLETNSEEDVMLWASIIDGRVFRSLDGRRPKRTGEWVDFNDLNDVVSIPLIAQPDPGFGFFSNGSPFGFFEIMAIKNPPGESQSSSRTFSTRSGSIPGANVLIAGPNGKRFGYQVYDGDSFAVTVQTPSNSIQEETVTSFALTRNSLSEANNLKMYIQNTLVTNASVTGFTVAGNSLTYGYIIRRRYLLGLRLLYDWTGYTSAEVESFSFRVRTLLEEEKANFTYPI